MARERPRWLKRILFLVIVGGIVFLGVSSCRSGPPPQVTLETATPGIGRSTEVTVAVSEPSRGLNRFRVELIQDETVVLLDEKSYVPREPWRFWGDRTPRADLTLSVGSDHQEQLREGQATLRVTAEPAVAWLSRPEAVVETLDLPVMLRPPQISITSSRTYVSQGGSEAVVYRVGETSIRDGVQAGDWFFPGYPLPGGEPDERFALFAAPFDHDDDSRIRLIALDIVGNQSTRRFVEQYNKRPFRNDSILLNDRFLAKVVPAIMDQTPELKDQGGLLENYLMINGDLRQKNAQTLVELAAKSQEDFPWAKVFMQMRNAQVRSSFADRRTYVYNGADVDQQDHLGFDLASTRQAELQAANNGTVVLARYFGIYGNAVVIDHGYGLMSLYGHLSSIDVDEGQQVARGEVIGKTGETGLAGGDHLHFTMLLHGLPVNPREWWDATWIRNRIAAKLPGTLKFGS
ncbi:MAG: M23 family metallopeptidase [Acidobacteriota bacterium]|nr:M23 family metallopeptidase [Acidobacteriota bacterium]MDH3785021.1 M23 family metallopeptidase [Acidobacteriota bacterium]